MEDRHLAEGEQDQINFLLSPRCRNKGRRNANRDCNKVIDGNDSSTTVHGTSVPSKIESPPRQPATYVKSGIEIPPQRHATPFRSTTESPRQRPSTPVQIATDSPAQDTIISISSAESVIRDPATPTRNVSESPRQQSVISISSTAESSARESFTTGQNVKRPTPSPITPAGTVQALDATAASVNNTVNEQDNDEQPESNATLVTLAPESRQAEEDTTTGATSIPAHNLVDAPDIPAFISVASDTREGAFRDIAGVQSCNLSEIATLEQVHHVVRARFGHELSRLHYPYEIKVCCYKLQVPDRRSYVALRKYRKAAGPYEYYEIMSELRARSKPVRLEVCVFDERDPVFKEAENSFMLAEELQKERQLKGAFLRIRADSPGSSDGDEGDSDEEVKITERRYRQLRGLEKEAARSQTSEAYEKRMKMEYWQENQDLKAELRRERGLPEDEDSRVSTAEESDVSEPPRKKAKKVDEVEETVEEQEDSESSGSEAFVESDDSEDEDYQE